MKLWNLKVLVARWMHLEPLEFKLVAYFYRMAADTVDGVVKRPRPEIAASTGILARKIRRLLQGLGAAGVVEVVSLAEEETVVRVLREHWSLPAGVAACSAPPASPAASPAEIKQLMFRLTGKRAALEDVQELMEAAGVNYEGLVNTLDYLLHRGARYEGFRRLAVDVAHQVKVWREPYEYWETSALAGVLCPGTTGGRKN